MRYGRYNTGEGRTIQGNEMIDYKKLLGAVMKGEIVANYEALVIVISLYYGRAVAYSPLDFTIDKLCEMIIEVM